MNKTILITAFEPFGGQNVNASQEVLKVLPGTTARSERATFNTRVPVVQIVNDMRAYPISVSDDAGTYVCNDTFYIVLDGLNDSDILADFIHVPYCPGQEKLRMADASGNETKTFAVLETEKAAMTVKRFIELAAERLT